MSHPPTPETGVKGKVTTLELSRAERSLARRGAETRAVVPSVELSCRVDMEACLAMAVTRGVRPLTVVLVVLAARLRDFPRLNGAYRDGRYELYSKVNLGIALRGAEGPVIGTLFDAAELDPDELDAELGDLHARAPGNELSAAELSGSTFTVVPPGPPGVRVLTPLILPSQSATLAVGAWEEAAVVRSGQLSVGQVSELTLACDHRIVPSHLGAEFLDALKRSLEAPGA